MSALSFLPSLSASAFPAAALSVDALSAFASLGLALALTLLVREKRPMPRAGWARAAIALAASGGLLQGFVFIADLVHLSVNAILAPVALLLVAAAMILTLITWRSMLDEKGEAPQTMQQLQAVIRQLEHEVAERRRAEEALQKSQELLRQLAAYQEQIKEDERKRIAREIHDELGQNLMALRLEVSILQARTGAAHPLLNAKVRYVLSYIDMSIKAVRAIINNLRPSVLDLGLCAAIEWQVSEFQRRTGIACVLDMEDGACDDHLDDSRATALFRIVQESLSNVARHAQATRVRLTLRREDEMLHMRISDNGVGIYPECRRKPHSFGLIGIGERVSSLGGRFVVDSKPGQGTTLDIAIPMPALAWSACA